MSQITMHNSNLQSTSVAKFYSGLKREREGLEEKNLHTQQDSYQVS
jgi:hypothetical protein